MARPPPSPAPVPASRPGGAAERIVIAVLVLMAFVLGYLRFGFLGRLTVTEAPPFDLRNPMLDARTGECIEVEDQSLPGSVACLAVADPGVVVRPARGHDQIGDYEGLRRSAPYLVCSLRTPPVGKSCSEDPGRPESWLLFDLNHFGMPAGIPVVPIRIRPVWRRWGGRTQYTYEVQMLRHDPKSGPWTLWITEDAPVTGTVYRQYASGRGATQSVVYREPPGCTPP